MCTCASLSNIAKACGTRGTAKDIVRAWIACENEVDTFPAATNGTISTDIDFLDEENGFYEIGIDKVGSSFNFTVQGEGYSKEFLNTATIFINGVSPEVSAILSGLIGGGYILIIEDKNGKRWLLGKAGDGAEIAPTAQNDRNGYSVVGTWAAPHMPYAYTGAIPQAA